MEQAENPKTFPQKAGVIHNGFQKLAQKLQTFLSDIRIIVDNFEQGYYLSLNPAKSISKIQLLAVQQIVIHPNKKASLHRKL